MLTGKFRRLLPAIAACLVLAIGAASIPAPGYAEGGEGRDSHDKTKEPKDPPKKNPRPPADFGNEKRF